MDNGRYQFTNWTDEPFEGRFGGVPYLFAPQETKEFDPDKLHMLHILAKQLTERELAKGAKGILRTKEAGNDYGKAIDANGNLYKPTLEDRKSMMAKAIGDLVDKSLPFPEHQEPEAGATKETTENITALQDQVKSLTDMVQGLVNQIGALKAPPSPAAPPTPAPVNPAPVNPGNGQVAQPAPHATLTRDALYEMVKDAGGNPEEGATKEQLIEFLGNTRGSAEPMAA